MVGARLVLAVLAVTGCTARFHGSAVQPNPVKEPADTLRKSETIRIVTGDMELNAPVSNGCTATSDCNATTYHNSHYPLMNEASFTLVSRDRLRFHVQIDHKWEEYADLNTWAVYLVDDKGRIWYPESVEHASTRIITRMWDRELRTAQRNQYGDIIAINDDGWKRRQTLGNLSVFRGRADFVFYDRDLFSVNVRSLKLVVKRPGESFEFQWRFQDNVATQ